jgi:hypothetical protein
MTTTPSTESKILTLNLDGKKGVNIDKAKYDQVRNAILEIIKSHETMTMADLSETVKQKLEGNFDGKIGWYFMAVKLDLEVRGEIERVAKVSPQTLKISQ